MEGNIGKTIFTYEKFPKKYAWSIKDRGTLSPLPCKPFKKGLTPNFKWELRSLREYILVYE